MYFTRGDIRSARPIKNAHHNFERERHESKARFLEFVKQYRKSRSSSESKPRSETAALPTGVDFSEYVRLLEARTSQRPRAVQPLDPPQRLRRGHTAQLAKEDRVVESCLPYFMVAIKSQPSSEHSREFTLNLNKMRRNDPLPLQRVRKAPHT